MGILLNLQVYHFGGVRVQIREESDNKDMGNKRKKK